MKSEQRIVFVIDALPGLGGAEKVLFTALEAYPRADIFTLIYNKDAFDDTPIANRNIKTSYLNALPLVRKHYRAFLPLMPSAIEKLNLRDYDRIVSFSYAVAHGVRNFNGAHHVSYTYTPMRYAWTDLNINGTQTRKYPIVDQYMRTFRKWDRIAASRVHRFASISEAVARRIQRAYQREAPVIHPPVEIERFHPVDQRDDYYITVSRLVPHKKLDLLVRAFTELKLPLLVIGEGPELPHLINIGGPNIQFRGYESDEKVAELMSRARGFVCVAEEDFGIAIVEAQAAGCPVIAFGQGGALETVIDGVTGIHFAEQSVECLIEAVMKFQNRFDLYQPNNLMSNANRFNKERFIKKFIDFVEPTNSGI